MSYNKTLQSNNTNLQTILATINTLPEAGGVELPTLTNPGTAEDLLLGKEFINSEGNIVTGSMPNNGTITMTMDGIETKSISIPEGYTSGGTVSLDSSIDEEVSEQTDLITEIKTVASNLPEAGNSGSGNTNIDTCTVILNIANNATVYGYSATIYTNKIQSQCVINGNTNTQITIEKVICGSGFSCLAVGHNSSLAFTIDGDATFNGSIMSFGKRDGIFTIGNTPNSTITITVFDDD